MVRHTLEDRQRVVDSFERGEDFIALAETLNIKRTTAYSIVRRYQATGRVAVDPAAGGRPRKLDDVSVDFLISLIDANPCITLKEMRTTLHEIFPQNPQVS